MAEIQGFYRKQEFSWWRTSIWKMFWYRLWCILPNGTFYFLFAKSNQTII